MLNSHRIINYCYAKTILNAFNGSCKRRTFHNVELNDIPKVTATDIRKLLRQKGFPVQDGFTSLTTKCTICPEQKTCGESKVYINKTTGYFLCPACNVHGSWSVLEKHVRKAKTDLATREHCDKCLQQYARFQEDWLQLVSKTLSLSDLTEPQLEDLSSLFEFTISLTKCNAGKVLSDVRVSQDRTTLYFPLKNSTDNIVGYREVQAGKEEEAETHGIASAGLFWCRPTKVSRGDQAVIVTSINDILHLSAQKVPGTHIWLNSSSLPPTLLPALEGYQKLCLWGDWENMRDIANKLGEDRCRFVRPTDGLVTASEAALAHLSLRSLVADAKPAAHRAITTFAALRDDVYAELSNIDKVRGVKWRRFPALTRLLGGHRRGELTVLTGPTGCGKTTLCAEMSLDLAQQGVTTLWGSFEIRNSRLARTMLQQAAGVPLEHHLDRFAAFADDFQKLPIYYLAFHGQQPIKVVMEAVEHARYMHDISHVVVDNVQFMLGLGDSEGDRYARQDAVVAAFRTFATARHTHVTLVMHPRKAVEHARYMHGVSPGPVVVDHVYTLVQAVEHARYMHGVSPGPVVVDHVQFMTGKERDSEDLSTSSIFGSAKASQEADNVLIIQDKRLTAVRGKKYLQVAKNRYSGDLGIVPLEFDKDALSYQAKKKSKAKSEEHDALLQQCFDEFAVEPRPGAAAPAPAPAPAPPARPARAARSQPADSYLSDILNLNRTR